MRTALIVTGAIVWAGTTITMGGALIWMLADRARGALQARREARTSLSDASLARFLEQASREGRP